MNKFEWRDFTDNNTGLSYTVAKCDEMDWEYIIEENKIDTGGCVYQVCIVYSEFEEPFSFKRGICYSTKEKAKVECENHYCEKITGK